MPKSRKKEVPTGQEQSLPLCSSESLSGAEAAQSASGCIRNLAMPDGDEQGHLDQRLTLKFDHEPEKRNVPWEIYSYYRE